MTFTLAIDTALAHCQAALIDEAGHVAAYAGAPAQGDAEAIVDHVAAVLAEAGASFDDVARVAVTVGPGSFTGVRVGVAYAKGVAFARQIPAVGVTTLEAMAHMAGGSVLAAIDARHGAVFALLSVEGPIKMKRMAVDEALELAKDVGAGVVGPADAVAALGEGEVIERIDLRAVAALAGGDPDGREPTPLYLAPVDARPQTHKVLARA
ncbi:tRNA (adenosine(37)-N6)-threonylcarbamoyltransferase complex dimerization subunit type 1 TsaB [Acuticoccus sediminis]|uniref:tRNA (adenosine(37)-N6)-threonylcarbamoyltransferase complex dimerization subunit type 1 TsaB n=1 Tax=Acuticoccus sediminis TaxID=2184697 RepID=UPI001391A3E5|nr:tRNA (adenosine(37)-N6)-threonylcarbamoyltransferase complex dimerization subunit type 1 TsaB [Acuticoccus sediminis]